MKAHIGVDAKEGHVHSVCTSAASVADCHMLPELLHGEERKVWGDGGYQGQTEGIKEAAPKAQDMTCKRTRFKNYVDENQRKKNRSKSSVRAKVEHVFRLRSSCNATINDLLQPQSARHQEKIVAVKKLAPCAELP